ncbi:MAG: hypothetical protein AVDCRST_MAG58-3098 [uncultured Rubrobacteraceae bacterium]|uniref:Uncharacterized protein n=1 Tax=uncultured Rubrobacteraceae bacterium TaxID=349277 RepID=A0A6J4R4J3_9ACTN|nr:MAG: hypothetical protein AVDCRST_MAG58-3098 [uncultured Rubrobacteraceae bacterium]
MAIYPRGEMEFPRFLAACMGRIGGKGRLLSHEQDVELGRGISDS